MDLALYMPGFLHVEHIKYKTCVYFGALIHAAVLLLVNYLFQILFLGKLLQCESIIPLEKGLAIIKTSHDKRNTR